MLAQLSERLRLQPADLQLDVEKCTVGKLLQNILQCGQREDVRRSELYLHFSCGCVVADNGLAISGTAHVEFKPVAAVLQTELERCQGIFRNLAESARPTM